jgi:hypothetical protein
MIKFEFEVVGKWLCCTFKKYGPNTLVLQENVLHIYWDFGSLMLMYLKHYSSIMKFAVFSDTRA